MATTLTIANPAHGTSQLPVLSAHLGSKSAIAESEKWLVVVSGEVNEAAPITQRTPDGAMERLSAGLLLQRWESLGTELLGRLHGSFAIVFVDRQCGTSFLTVDRFGTRSLFYTRTSIGWRIATEPAALVEGRQFELDKEGWEDVLSIRIMGGPHTLWRHIKQTPPAAVVKLERDGKDTVRAGLRWEFSATKDPARVSDAADETIRLLTRRLEHLRESGVERVVVPLSGGVDSSILAALAVKVFPHAEAVTVKFDDFENPELDRAIDVANRLGIPIHIASVSNADVTRAYPIVLERLQEPPRHFNNVAVFRMLETMADRASHILSGDSVEPFGVGTIGTAMRLARRVQLAGRIPEAVRNFVARSIRTSDAARLNRLADLLDHNLEDLLRYQWTIRYSKESAKALGMAKEVCQPSSSSLNFMPLSGGTPDEKICRWAFYTIEHAIFRRNTRLADHFGMTYEYPFQEPELGGMCAAWPQYMRFEEVGQRSKPVLREVCARLVGSDVAEWPKLGFPSPEAKWLNGPLRLHVDSALSPGSRVSSFIDVDTLRIKPAVLDRQAVWVATTLNDVLRTSQTYLSENRICVAPS